MSRIRKSKTNNKFFLDIPKPDEMDDKEKLKKKYKKTTLEINKKKKLDRLRS